MTFPPTAKPLFSTQSLNARPSRRSQFLLITHIFAIIPATQERGIIGQTLAISATSGRTPT